MATAPKMKILKGAATQAEAVEVVDTQVAEVATAEATPPKTKSKSILKSKTTAPEATETVAVEVPKAKTTVAAADYLETIDAKINALTSEEAFEMVPDMLNRVDQTYFELGGVLSRIQTESWYADKGYENFRAYVESEGGMQYRKAMYLVSIYVNLTNAGVSWDSVKALGWTILKDLAQYLTPENVDEWVEAIKGMTVLQAQEYIRAKTTNVDAGSNSDEATAQATTALTTVTFKVHEDQKATIRDAIAKNKKEAGTEFDAVALENICLDYLASSGTKKAKPVKAPSVEDSLKGLGAEAAIELFNKVFADVDMELSIAQAE